jgi:tRNA A-37 threonylcarbamoyl transferase component Bud32
MNKTGSTGSTDTPITFEGKLSQPLYRQLALGMMLLVTLCTLITLVIGIYNLYEYLFSPSGVVPLVQTNTLQSGLTVLSTEVFFVYRIVIILAITLVFAGTGWLIYLGHSESQMSVFTAVFLISLGAALSPAGIYIYETPSPHLPNWLHGLSLFCVTVINLVGWGSTGLFFTVFPDGRFVPAWSKYLVLFTLLFSAGWGMFPQQFNDPQSPIAALVSIGILITFSGILAVQVYRYRRVSSAVQRQQTKWFLYGLAVIAAGILIGNVLLLQLSQAVPEMLPLYDLSTVIVELLWLALPLTIATAIFKYRLWDVDILINRSLVYGVATFMLVVLFSFSVLILNSLLGASNQLAALVVSAIGPIVLFNPTRRRAQHWIDRNLYRLRFDLNQLQAAQKPAVATPGALTGRILGGYEVLDVIGKGGMGEVYKAYRDGEEVAIKVMPEDKAQDIEQRIRFQREAQTLLTLDHPGIVKMSANGSEENVHYIVMQYLKGEDLKQLISRAAPMPAEETYRLIEAVCTALDYAHEQGIVHRDIKPSNIMITLLPDNETSVPIVMDFGVARIQDVATRYTGTGAIGTIDYMAPEQILNAREVDRRADVYALGITTYEMLTGKRPFEGSVAQVLFAHIQQPAPDPRDINSALPRHTAKAILRALEKAPADRFQSAGEFAQALKGQE